MDTLSVAKSLEAAGFKREKAETIAQWFQKSDDIATKDFVHKEIARLSNRMFATAVALIGISTTVIIAAVKYL